MILAHASPAFHMHSVSVVRNCAEMMLAGERAGQILSKHFSTEWKVSQNKFFLAEAFQVSKKGKKLEWLFFL